MAGKQLKPCGTPAARRRHIRKGEEVCEACRRAHVEEVTWYQRRGPVPPRELRPCGTEAAYQRHIRRGELADDACLKAHAEHVAKYYRPRRTAPRTGSGAAA
jgi:hypothetical protein